jgi:glycosyltransferase involved in cell wall biosynthesis
LAVIVSHPIQYYVPVYRLLAQRNDVVVRVFYTWHAGQGAYDAGFEKEFAWDVPLTDGYEFEVVTNTAHRPGTNHFWGLRNPGLVDAVLDWRPDVVHLTGYAYTSHLSLLRSLSARGVPVLFRGDSHLLTPRPWWKRQLATTVLKQVFRYPAACLYVGTHNRNYYRACGVPERKLFYCPHSIDFERFAEPAETLEAEARAWRHSLGIGDDQFVLLFAGKFQEQKQPVELMQAVMAIEDKRVVLVLIGDGTLEPAMRAIEFQAPERFRFLPFQNQTRMPIAYRLGNAFVLASKSETWGLGVNEAMACSRPALVSDRVGCAPDMVEPGVTGDVFESGNWNDFRRKLASLVELDHDRLCRIGAAAREQSSRFTPRATAEAIFNAGKTVLADRMN